MENSELRKRAELYAADRGLIIDFSRPIGFGNDGCVWRTHRNSAVKTLESRDSYSRERDCYRRLMDRGVKQVEGLTVPTLLDFDDQLLVVEMRIVEPPFLLDFGKAYLDGTHPYSPEQLQAYYGSLGRHFRVEDLPRVMKICRILRGYGIEYLDAKPKNIWLRSFEEEAALPDDDWEREIPEPPVEEEDR